MKITSIHSKSLILIVFLLFSVLNNAEPLKPMKITNAPVIDGLLNDEIWLSSPTVTGFRTFAPDFGKELSQKTVVYMAYDSANLYFAYHCFDKEPTKIKASITNRDNIRSDDWICLNLDSFGDQQSLYAFYVNPYGIQADSRYSNNVEDESVDMVWYSAGKINDEGYVAELQIPLKSIRYSDKNPVEMSVFFERRISRTSEQGSYPEFDPAKGYAMLTQMKPMIYDNLEHYTLVEILPAFTYGEKYSIKKNELHSDEKKGEISLTAKYGITSDLIIDGTYNPDFSQVESDAGQVDVNLRYSLYYPEKRPFFLEGNEHFKLAATQSSELDPIRSIVHTRNIVSPIAGLKLTGKLSENTTLASIYAVDDAAPGNGENSNTHFAILRFKQKLHEDSFVGAVFTDKEFGENYNRVGGIDGMLRLTKSSTIEYNGLMSLSKTEENSSSKKDHAVGLAYSAGTRDLEYGITLKDISKGFNAASGYITRTGITTVTGIITPRIYPESDIFRRLDFEIFSAQTNDKFSSKWETFNHASLNFVLPGNFQFKVKYSYSTEVFENEKFETGGYHVFGGGWISKELYAGVLYRRIGAIYYSDNPYQGNSNRLTANVVILPSDKISADLSFVFYDFRRESDNHEIYQYPISRLNLSYQFNKYFLFRGIAEYNDYRDELLTDLLASFTYIPGTVFHIGYGSIYEKLKWDNDQYVRANNFLETRRGFFLKVSYLWRS